ncbi:MAG TPA: VOC family protein [Candidatus Limnocylindrales bacterium]|nr:VOC family protein [Candidatus Limnocylindrales bacterium]
MAEQNYGEQLDRFVDAVISSRHAVLPDTDAELASLARVAADLRGLPRESFKERLKADLTRRTSMSSKPVAAQETTVSATPYLTVNDAAAAIEFYKKAFGAVEVMRLVGPGTKIGHAEIRIGNALFMLADEFPDYGEFSPQTVGGSPIKLHMYVPDVDAAFQRAVEAGATVVRPVADQFYGDRSGQVKDPFGYRWILSTHKEDVSAEEMERRMKAWTQQAASAAKPTYRPEGFHTVQPYLVAADGAALLDFAKAAFGAEETMRAVGPAGGIHGEVRIGDSMVMIGGGIPGRPFDSPLKTTGLHVYVKDTDAVYAQALAAGATSLGAPQDHEYGERGASVKDPAGNFWYIATHKGESYIPKGLNNVNVYLHPRRAEPLIAFMKKAFGAQEIGKYASPDGVVHHAEIRVGDSVVEMGESHGAYEPMPSMLYLYVSDPDATYRQALAAGAKSLHEPVNQPYGDRNASFTDAFGNTWYVAAHIGDVKS